MTNLKQLVLDKIEQLGPEEAAEYFGITKSTAKVWKSTGRVPLDAAQKVFDEIPIEVPGPMTATEITGTVNENEQIWARLSGLNDRVSRLEGAPVIAEPKAATPSYGFRDTVINSEIVPPHQVSTIKQTPVLAPPITPEIPKTSPVIQGNRPYLPDNRNWSQPHRPAQNSRV